LRIATYWWGGRRHVGRLSADGTSVVPFAAIPLDALIPVPRRNICCTCGVGIGFEPPRYLKRGDVLENPVQ